MVPVATTCNLSLPTVDLLLSIDEVAGELSVLFAEMVSSVDGTVVGN